MQNGYAFDSGSFSSTDGMPLIRIRDLKGGKTTETKYAGGYDDAYIVRTGDLLIGMDGEFGCYQWDGELALLNQRVCRLRNFRDTLLPRFLYYGVNSHLRDIENVTGFTTVKHLSSKQILRIEFAVPPLPEQRRIVGILDEAFAGIATAKANAEQNLRNARALFESHLEAIFTNRNESSDVRRLGEVVTIQNGFAFKSSEYTQAGYFVMRIANVQDGRIDLTSPKYIELADQKLRRFILNEGDILVSLTGNIGRVGLVKPNHLPAVLNQRVARITPRSGLDREYLFRFLSSRTFRDGLQEVGHGAAQQNVSTSEIEAVTIALPSQVQEQQRIAREFEAFHVETQRLASLYQQKLAALDALKKSLLHQAFSGQLGGASECAGECGR